MFAIVVIGIFENEFKSVFKVIIKYSMEIVRYKGKWYKIIPKPYEPEHQTYSIAWMMIREPMIVPEVAYRKYFQTLREEAKVFYPSFRKENAH